MFLAAVPLALWGAWALWASLDGRHWALGVLGGAALIAAGGLLLLKVWAKYLTYFIAAGLSLSWTYAVGRMIFYGWPYDNWLATLTSLVPGACLLAICAGGSYVVNKQYRRGAQQT